MLSQCVDGSGGAGTAGAQHNADSADEACTATATPAAPAPFTGSAEHAALTAAIDSSHYRVRAAPAALTANTAPAPANATAPPLVLYHARVAGHSGRSADCWREDCCGGDEHDEHGDRVDERATLRERHSTRARLGLLARWIAAQNASAVGETEAAGKAGAAQDGDAPEDAAEAAQYAGWMLSRRTDECCSQDSISIPAVKKICFVLKAARICTITYERSTMG